MVIPTGFSWLSLIFHDWISLIGIIIMMRIRPGLAVNENWISVQHDTHYLSTLNLDLLWLVADFAVFNLCAIH